MLSLLDIGEFETYEMPAGSRFCCLAHDFSIVFGKPINPVILHLLRYAHEHRRGSGRGCIPPKFDRTPLHSCYFPERAIENFFDCSPDLSTLLGRKCTALLNSKSSYAYGHTRTTLKGVWRWLTPNLEN